MARSEDFVLRPMQEADLEMVRAWRNSERIRTRMFNDHHISVEEHQTWFQMVQGPQSQSMANLVFQGLGKPLGLVNFTGIDRKNGTCSWGFYLGEDGLPRGTGTIMGLLGLDHAFEVLGLRKVYGEVVASNYESLGLFKSLGFHEEGRLDKHILRHGKYVDVVKMALFREEWLPRREERKQRAFSKRRQVTYVIAASHSWYKSIPDHLAARTRAECILIDRREELTPERLRMIQPKFVFFPHWSHRVPPEIFDHFECVMFHMTDLPFGRGGTPLQNLLARGIYDTTISAFRCTAGLDAGPIYLKRPLSLFGTAEEIYMRAAKLIEEMMVTIISKRPEVVPQQGKSVSFTRRHPEDGNLSDLGDLGKAFDLIRMTDADGYPKAFLETKQLRFEFQRAALKPGMIIADVVITAKKEGEA